MGSDKLQVILTEYEKLRDEIQRRSRDQLFSITISIASVGTITGVAIKDISTNYLLLLMIPWILAVFGICWLDHAIFISRIGLFIKSQIETKKMKSLFSNNTEDLLSWERYIDEKRKRGKVEFIIFFLPLFYFIIPSMLVTIVFLTNFSSKLSCLALILIVLFYSILTFFLAYKWIQAMIFIRK